MADKIPAPKCVWCGADWDEPMIDAYHYAGGCPTCDYGSSTEVTIKIHCSGCKKLVYAKEWEG